MKLPLVMVLVKDLLLREDTTTSYTYIRTYIPSSSMIVMVADEMPRLNDKQLGNSFIAIQKISLSSSVISSVMFISNNEEVDPA